MKDDIQPAVTPDTATRIARQSSLDPAPNPAPQLDYLCRLTGALTNGGGTLEISVAYVPDRGVLTELGFAAYLATLADAPETMEALAVIVTDDLNNELVPRWVQVRIRRLTDQEESPIGASVLVEDRQPNWSNPELLNRMRGF